MDVTRKDENLSTPLHLASSFGVSAVVQLLIKSGTDVTEKDGSGRTPLHLAASSPVSSKAASLFFRLTFDVNGQNDYHLKPSSLEPNMKANIVRSLIDHGEDIAALDETLLTPLHLAANHGHPKIVWLLIDHGADVTAQDRGNRTPLHLALSKVSSLTTSL
jgi:ankyrin repeat protein